MCIHLKTKSQPPLPRSSDVCWCTCTSRECAQQGHALSCQDWCHIHTSHSVISPLLIQAASSYKQLQSGKCLLVAQQAAWFWVTRHATITARLILRVTLCRPLFCLYEDACITSLACCTPSHGRHLPTSMCLTAKDALISTTST